MNVTGIVAKVITLGELESACWTYAEKNGLTRFVMDCYNARMTWEEIASILLKNA